MIIESLQQHPNASPFNQPVDAEALNLPTYHRVIKHPMDFGTISTSTYQSVGQFREDVQLVFKNCYKFNGPRAEVSEWARQVEMFFEELWAEVFPH